MSKKLNLGHNKFTLGNSKLIGIQVAGFGKNGGSRGSEEMLAYLVARWKSSKTIGGEDIRNSERRLEMHFRAERRAAGGSEGVVKEERLMAGEPREELLNTL